MRSALFFTLCVLFSATAAWGAPTYQVKGGALTLASEQLFLELGSKCEVSAITPGGALPRADRGRVRAITGAIDIGALEEESENDTLLGYVGYQGGLRIGPCYAENSGAPIVELQNLEVDFLDGEPVVTAIVILDGDLIGRTELLVPAQDYVWEPEYGPGNSGLFIFLNAPFDLTEDATGFLDDLGINLEGGVVLTVRAKLHGKPGNGEGKGPEDKGPPEGKGPEAEKEEGVEEE